MHSAPAVAKRRPGSRFVAILICAAVAASGLVLTGVTGGITPAAAAETDLLDCTPTSPFVYNLRSPDQTVGGERVNRVERVNVTTGEVEVIADFSAASAPPDLVIEEQVNGLGIRRDAQGRGRWLVFSTSNIADLEAPRNVYQYDLLTEELVTSRIPDEIWAADSNHTTRHGAVDLSTGIYYTATHRNNTDEFTLIAFDFATEDVWLAGHLATPGASGSSGDMAFDSLGNLFFVVGGQSSARQFTGPAGSLPTTPGEQVELTLTDIGGAATDDAAAQQVPPLSRTNGVGVAFGPDGYLYETFGSGFLYRVDPSTGTIVPDSSVRPQDVALVDLGPAQPGSSARGGSSTDLATCASPSTLEVLKYVNHRAEDADQFTLSVARDDGVPVGEPATTSGDDDGLQAEKVGPVGILSLHEDGTTPWSHTITEVGAGSTDLADYDTSYRCVDRNDPGWGSYEGTLSDADERSFTIPTPPRGAPGGSRAIVCTLTNAAPGNPIIQKSFDAGTPSAVVDDVTVTGTYRCEFTGTDPATVNEGTWIARGAAPALLVPAEGSSTDVPIGSVCRVWEDELENSVFPDDSWAWGTPVLSPETPGDPASATVTITADDPVANTVSIVNSARQSTGPLQIVKDFTGEVPDWVAGVVFDGTYTCTYPGLDTVPGTDDDIVNAGTWQITGIGGASLDPEAPALPVNSRCTITENAPSDEDLPDAAWHWLAPAFEPASTSGTAADLTVRDPEANVATITNSATAFRIVKAFPEGAPEWLNEVTYTGEYVCDTGAGSIGGSWTITGAGIADLAASGDDPSAIPLGSTCTATEDPLDDADLPDDTWSWASAEISPASVTIGSNLEAGTLTVTNDATQELPTTALTVEKAFADDAPEWLADVTYTGTYVCASDEVELTGSWSVTGEGAATLTPEEGSTTDFPVGSECTVAEDALDPESLPNESWAWEEPVIDPVPVVLADDGDNTVTVTNNATQATTDLAIFKTFTEGSPAWVNEITYTGAYACLIGEERNSGTWSAVGGSAALLVPDEGTSANLPVGSECTVTEDALDPELLPNESWAWRPPVITPVPLVLTSDGENSVMVTNSAAQATTGMNIVKAFPEDSPGWLGEITYTGTYSCVIGEEMNTGTWSVTGAGEAMIAADAGTSSALPVGSLCDVAEDLPPEGVLPNSSWSWEDPIIDPVPLELTVDGDNTVTVTNSATQALTALTVVKAFGADSPEWMNEVTYTGTYRCAIDDEVHTGDWAVTGAGVAVLTPAESSSTDIPVGSACTVAENALDDAELPDATWSWSAPVVDPNPLILADGAENTITVTNGAEQVPMTTLAIEKVFPEGAADWLNDVGYTGEYTCSFADISYAGTWAITGTGAAVLQPGAELPIGAECSATEDAPSADDLPDASWAWDEAVVNPTTLVLGEDAETNVLTVTNSASRVTGDLEIHKVLADGSPEWLDGITYTGTFVCSFEDENYDGTWSVTGAGTADLAPDREVPNGAVCSVSEDELRADDLPDRSWQWEQPRIDIQSITIDADAPVTPVQVTNAVQHSGAPEPAPIPPTPAPPGPGPLPTTGGDAPVWLMSLAGVGLLLGAGLLALSRRRERQSASQSAIRSFSGK
ncbi:DUF5979 domain-containing protein [Leucobacter sp. L43]|uniref:DUF5979 domain-containing protein n=1 Tax=Leucobacter sp. L43 TaxID=2798040 RepID=UPI0019078CFD|nr:DUF5979 domain-containing protein [Leucobacter sp. L43]